MSHLKDINELLDRHRAFPGFESNTMDGMKPKFSLPVLLAAAVLMAGSGVGCTTAKGVMNALTNLQKLQFKLDNVNNFRVNGIDISRISQPSQISPLDIARLGAMIASKSLPVSFTLNVAAKNPNDGSGGTQSTPLYLRKLAWTLLVDNRTTINGVVDQRLSIPGSGQSVTIPLTMNLDLYKFFSDKGLDDLMNLALAVGGAQGSASRLKLTARVSVETPIGVIDYPGDLTIVDRQFSNP